MKQKQDQVYLDYKKQIRKSLIKPIAIEAAHEKKVSKEEERKTIRQLTASMEEGLDEYLAMIHEGVMILQLEGRLPASLADGKGLKAIKDQKWLAEGKILQEGLGITNDEFVAIYALAKEYYDRTAYREATALFFLMTEINPTVSIGWQGLGMCYEQQEKFKEAASLYIMGGELEEENLSPYFWAADCLNKLGLKQERAQILEHVIERCGKEKKAFKEEAKKLLKS